MSVAVAAAALGNAADLAAPTLPKGAKVLERRKSRLHGEVGVYELRGKRLLYSFDGKDLVVESLMSLASATALPVPYLTTMALVAAITGERATIFNWGLGGGSLTRFYLARYPRSRITSAEIDPDLLALAKKYFQVEAPNHELLNLDAVEWLRGSAKRYDVIWHDAWLPSGGEEARWHDLVKDVYPKRLAPGGVVAIWCGGLPRSRVSKLAAAAQSGFKHVLILRPRPQEAYHVLALSNNPRLTCKKLAHLHESWVSGSPESAKLDVRSKGFCAQQSSGSQ